MNIFQTPANNPINNNPEELEDLQSLEALDSSTSLPELLSNHSLFRVMNCSYSDAKTLSSLLNPSLIFDPEKTPILSIKRWIEQVKNPNTHVIIYPVNHIKEYEAAAFADLVWNGCINGEDCYVKYLWFCEEQPPSQIVLDKFLGGGCNLDAPTFLSTLSTLS
jgi:hypothetical protein